MTPLVVWFFYINLAALIFSLLGWLAEWVLLAYGRSVRRAWVVTMMASVVLPLSAIVWGDQLLLVEGVSAIDRAIADGLLTVAGNEVSYTAAGEYHLQADFDRWILLFWTACSGLTLVWLGWSTLRLKSARTNWLRTETDKGALFITPSLGPGVMGVLDQRILLPQWVLGLNDEERELIWLHEREHVRAGDNRLLAGGLLLIIGFPWILSLWWQFRRLRVAVELDCDRRVVQRDGNWREYGELLIRVAEGSTLLPVAPFSSRRSPLRRRIRTLLPTRPPYRALRSTGAVVASLVLLAGWLALPVPAEGNNWTLSPLPFPVLRETLDPPHAEYDQHPRLLNREDYRSVVDRLYPEHLRTQGIGDTVGVFIHVAADGKVNEVRLDRSSAHETLNAAAMRAARSCRFRPARRDGTPVGTWLFLSVKFHPPG